MAKRNKAYKHLGLEIDPVLHYKLKYISSYEGRSMSGHILYLLRQNIAEFERNVDRIELPKESD